MFNYRGKKVLFLFFFFKEQSPKAPTHVSKLQDSGEGDPHAHLRQIGLCVDKWRANKQWEPGDVIPMSKKIPQIGISV